MIGVVRGSSYHAPQPQTLVLWATKPLDTNAGHIAMFPYLARAGLRLVLGGPET